MLNKKQIVGQKYSSPTLVKMKKKIVENVMFVEIIIAINYLIENNTLILDKNKVIKNKGQA